jgi:hypothetical protein
MVPPTQTPTCHRTPGLDRFALWAPCLLRTGRSRDDGADLIDNFYFASPIFVMSLGSDAPSVKFFASNAPGATRTY